eukprot:9082321-Pyramimonas_sp.AAC.1
MISKLLLAETRYCCTAPASARSHTTFKVWPTGRWPIGPLAIGPLAVGPSHWPLVKTNGKQRPMAPLPRGHPAKSESDDARPDA